jgi:hypothetical protein
MVLITKVIKGESYREVETSEVSNSGLQVIPIFSSNPNLTALDGCLEF